ncbi:MAG TPA: cytochrome c oxidase assembly factor Coa1 family protein [Thermoanaerobaculia bacterium]|nr:cytochrome c oxidase assembly factor Coa1 family protein [Thermoanaerobaculia bacterium]
MSKEMDQAMNTNWWSRNWKWFVPVGCLSSLLLIGAFIALIMSFAFGIMKSSEPYKVALSKAKANAAVVEALGTPIKEGYFTSGSVNVSGPSGSAELAIPISGPKGSGTIYLEARKSAGEWSFSKLAVKVDKTTRRIDLLDQR